MVHNNLYNFIDKKKFKVFSLLFLIFASLFLAFNNYPPLLSIYETSIIYKSFLPINNPALVLSISEDASTTGNFHVLGYAALNISRHISDYIGHNLLSIRLPSVIYSLITLFFFYKIINKWFDWKVAYISSFLLITNNYFLLFQKFLLVQMVTLLCILFMIERYQKLSNKNTKLTIITFSLACALTTLHYIAARYFMIGILFFYLIDFNKFSFLNFKTYLNFTNSNRVKNFLLFIVTIITILTIFYPPNVFILFSKAFFLPIKADDYLSANFDTYINNIIYNLKFYFHFFIFGKSNAFPSDLMLLLPNRIDNIIILCLLLLGIIISLTIRASSFTIFIFFVFLMAISYPLLSNLNLNTATYYNSTSFHSGRIIFSIPFMCLFATLGLKYIYSIFANSKMFVKPIFILLIISFFTFRFYDYFGEIKRFNNYISTYEINFKEPAPTKCLTQPDNYIDSSTIYKSRERHHTHIYYLRLAKFISSRINQQTYEKNVKQVLYVPEDYFTPCLFKIGDNIPTKGEPYYFPMFLTIYLQEQGIEASYFVKKNETKKNYLYKFFKVINRYKSGSKLPEEYPRNQQQENIVKFFIVIVDFLNKYNLTQNLVKSDEKDFKINKIQTGNYRVNITSRKKPNFLIAVNEEQLNEAKNSNNYNLLISLPLL